MIEKLKDQTINSLINLAMNIMIEEILSDINKGMKITIEV